MLVTRVIIRVQSTSPPTNNFGTNIIQIILEQHFNEYSCIMYDQGMLLNILNKLKFSYA